MTERLPIPDEHVFPTLDGASLRLVQKHHPVGRIFFASGPYPSSWDAFRSFGPTSSRFDHHPRPKRVHPTRAVQYAAPWSLDVDGDVVSILATCLVECFRDPGLVDMSRHQPFFALFRPARDLVLLDLVDSDWVARAGGNGAISTGLRSRSRQWSRAIYSYYGVKGGDSIDGLWYQCSNLTTARSVVLYEVARDALPEKAETIIPLDHPALRPDIERVCRRLGLDLV